MKRDSNTVTEFMGSYIQIGSISIDLTNSVGKRNAGKCEHFSIRGYVSEICKKDWKFCWPFPVDESQEQPSHPPLDVPKYKCWCCQRCPQESAAKDIDKNDQTNFESDSNCSNAALKSATMQDPMLETLERRNIDLNSNLCCVTDLLPDSNEKEKKAGVVLRRTDLEIGLENNFNNQVTSFSLPNVCPGFIQEVHVTKRGCDGNIELVSNHQCMDKSSAEIYNRAAPSADNQCKKKLIKSCTTLWEGQTAMEPGNATDHTSGHPPLELVACNHTVPAGPEGTTDDMDEDDLQDHHLEKSDALYRRRPRKVRLMADLLSVKNGRKTEQITRQGSPSHGTSNASAAAQPHSIFPGMVDTQGYMTSTSMCQSRKRKFHLDEAQRHSDMCIQRVEIKIKKGDAKTIDTALDTRPKSKDVMTGIGLQDAAKGYWSNSGIERNHIMSKKNKKIQVNNKYLIPEPCQGQQRENEVNMDTADMAYASKTLSSRFSHCAFTGKGMDKFPFHTLRKENEFDLSKGKGKMLQTDGELDSLSCQRNDILGENSFSYSGGKVMSNMPVDFPIPFTQGALNGKGMEEGLPYQVYNQKCIHQIENRLPFPLPLQEPTSNVHQPKRKNSEINVFGGPIIPSNHITNALSGKGVCCEEITGVRYTARTVEALEQLGVMKRYSEQTAEVSEQGALDDIPMEIVELLARNQYERHLLDVENRSCTWDKSTINRKTQMTVGDTVYDKRELSLLKEGQKVKHHGAYTKSNIATSGENVKPSKSKPVRYLSPFDGNNLGINNPCPPQPHFGFEVSQSQNIQFSHMGSSHLDRDQNCKLNGYPDACKSSNATLRSHGGCSLHTAILQQDDEASRIWASLTTNHVSLGYDVPKKVVFQPTSANVDITSLQSGTQYKQNMKRDINPCSNLNVAGLEKPNRSTGPGTFNRVNGGYPFPGKHNGMERQQNLRASLDMYSNETMPAMHLLSLMDAGMQSRMPFNEGVNAQMLRRPSYHGDCNTKMEIGTSKTYGTPRRQLSDYYSRSYLSDKPHSCLLESPTFVASSSTQHHMNFIRATGGFDVGNSLEFGRKEKMKCSNSAMQNRVSKHFRCPSLITETPMQNKLEVPGTHETLLPVRVTLGNICMVNRNPADFTMPEAGNLYMLNGEDLKFEKRLPKKRHRFPTPHGCKQQRNLKGTKMKEHSKH
ncbi:PREDICTED: protein EMBRYONIC FLOWER 1-like isoform X1 [Lupinus angustifolius]|uniref:protein EMBRYONIC FLOWER 1-like isoform X1 n=1 Tax=Lupinus angustifolius TaxID=3871 RepID=UPI00092E5843|nr:PREDICTED: protein EMBRYONIC FLOWER 1-like isoform X1 [Lupinus angustifolius]XP_019413167.1 PREDICTED: protein EMBRYONIC FLOWER 1-like isoform X1 [Lupinus angustifolius]